MSSESEGDIESRSRMLEVERFGREHLGEGQLVYVHLVEVYLLVFYLSTQVFKAKADDLVGNAQTRGKGITETIGEIFILVNTGHREPAMKISAYHKVIDGIDGNSRTHR